MFYTYREVAHELGLELTPKTPPEDRGAKSITISGSLDGQPVRLVRGAYADVTTTSPIWPPLDLGLELRREGIVTAIAELLGAHEIQLGETSFDAVWAIRGDEPERVRALLQPSLRAELQSLQMTRAQLTDSEFTNTISQSSESKERLAVALREAVRVARAVDAARAAVPVARALFGHCQVWTAFARAHQLRVLTAPLSMDGRRGRTFLSARAGRKSVSEIELFLSAGAEQSLGAGLIGIPRRSLLERVVTPAAWPPVSTADDAFDERFETRAREPEKALPFLGPTTRRLLMELGDLGAVSFNDTVVTLEKVNASAIEPTRVIHVLELLQTVVESRFVPTRGYR